jgi:DNA-binding transcriptional ArsR family regulator
MTEPLSDRIFDALGDPIARAILRELVDRERSQSDLVSGLDCSQPAVSRGSRILRALGLVVGGERTRGDDLRLTARPELLEILFAVDHMADKLLAAEVDAQKQQSRRTRRAAIKPANSADDADDGAGERPPGRH